MDQNNSGNNSVTDIEKVLEESLGAKDVGYNFRKAFVLFFPWDPQADGWVIYSEGKPWQKVISLTTNFNIRTYGKYFPAFVWKLAENLWMRFPTKNVCINNQPIKNWSNVVQS